MIGIEAIAHYLPEKRISNLERMAQLDMEEAFVREKLGFLQVSRAAEGETTSALAAHAVKALQEKTGLDLSTVDCLVVCTQTPDGHGIPHTSAVVHGKLGLAEHCATFDIGLGCSGYVYGLACLQGFMAVTGRKNGILVTADPYSVILDASDRNTEPIFGDGATATWLRDEATWQIGPFDLCSNGREREALSNADGHLHMNGRAVFNFTMTRVPEQINRLLESNGLGKDDVDVFILHQGSRYIVEQIGKRLGLSPEKAPFEASAYGNTVSSSIPLLLEPRLSGGGHCFVLSGFGVGLSWASCLVRRAGHASY